MIFLLKIFIYPISLLPLSVIRLILFPIKLSIKYLLKYREKIILKNLKIAFPNKEAAYYKKIQHKFYDNLYMLICESLKGFTISEKEAAKKMRVLNPEVLDKLAEKSQSAIMVFGHFNNWEWTPLSCPSQIKHQIAAIYQPIKNKKINDWILHNRSRTGVIMMSTKEINDFYDTNKLVVTNTFIADQSPSKKGSGTWVDFFGRKTLFLAGAAVNAKKMNHPIVFIDIQRVKFGFYEITIEELCPNPINESIESMVQKFATRLEEQIKKHPGSWLWSHNRWKHSYSTNSET